MCLEFPDLKKKKFPQEDSAIHHFLLCSCNLFSANISPEQHVPHGWLNKMKKESFMFLSFCLQTCTSKY